MPPLSVHIKHAGKAYDLSLDPDLPPNVFKDAIYHATGVPPDRMKVMVKGGVLKDDSSWKKIGPKDGQTFTVIGAAGELPKPPPKPIVFLEDMDDSELAEALAKPVGLTNLGNTCYMNATVQALRAVPELQVALNAESLQSTTPLPAALRDLYRNMSRTTDSITPMKFLQILREVNPQFAEMDRRESQASAMMMRPVHAQQDAEECYGSIINTLRNVPGLDHLGFSSSTGAEAVVGRKRFVEQYMMGEMRRELRCDEALEEPPVVSTEQVLKIECNISISTNFMLTGIMNSLDTKVEKNSPSLGRQAIYSQKSRLSRLPSYLTVHMVRFYWRDDIMKKAKIMRKVKFPLEFDALDLATDELRAKMLPVSRRLKEIEKERSERRKVRKRTKTAGPSVPSASTAAAAGGGGDVEMLDASAPAAATAAVGAGSEGTEDKGKGEGAVPGEDMREEWAYRLGETAELSRLTHPEMREDIGCSPIGLYDLVAIVTHKGAAADGGHYIGFVKKSMFNAFNAYSKDAPTADESLSMLQNFIDSRLAARTATGTSPPAATDPTPAATSSVPVTTDTDVDPTPSAADSASNPALPGTASGDAPMSTPFTSAEYDEMESDEDWYKFDDEKVSVFPKEKLATLDGGGEDSSAYVLLYRSKSLV